ncbi:MAG: GNAT family N-acetyltransferase [Gammaproteobacteria bacterium]|nr:GNAT family N-acetyltransferase [Gammaproteobacteria bacterium]
MNRIRFPVGFRVEPLRRRHPRRDLLCGESGVDDWLKTKALQHRDKHLSVTKVLSDSGGRIAGFYTLAPGQVDFSDLPPELIKRMPRRSLPVAVLAWLGVDQSFRGQGLGRLLLARALRDCYESGQTFAFVAVILDCINDSAKAFYEKWDFREFPGHENRLFLSWRQLEAMMNPESV